MQGTPRTGVVITFVLTRTTGRLYRVLRKIIALMSKVVFIIYRNDNKVHSKYR